MKGNLHLNPSVVGQLEALEDGGVGRMSEIEDGVRNSKCTIFFTFKHLFDLYYKIEVTNERSRIEKTNHITLQHQSSSRYEYTK